MVTVVKFGLHGWSRHVCKECTGQLVLLVNESPARVGQQPKTTKAPTKQPNKTQTTNSKAGRETQVSHARVKQQVKPK